MNKPIPYTFISIDCDKAIHAPPMPRDGSSTEDRLSGELLITLEALTPLLVGNHHHQLDEKHSAIAPEQLPDGRVLIAGSSLKGMIRHALSSLLNAPMERVLNRHYTYRPNLGFGPTSNPTFECRPAVITKISEDGNTVEVKLLPADSTIAFIREEVRGAFDEDQPGDHIEGECEGVKLVEKGRHSPTKRLIDVKHRPPEKLDHYFFTYRGGIDGVGHLTRAFNATGETYRAVLVPRDDYERVPTLTVPKPVIEHYRRTQDILSNEQYGHLSPGHPLLSKVSSEVSKAIKDAAKLEKHQLIYVEIEHGQMPNGKTGIRINSLGHHFQYRWAYTSSTREKDGKLRPELAHLSVEAKDDTGKPAQLAANRLLFGYALDGKDDALASGNWKRLAGRISPNTAIEVIRPGKEAETERFVNAGQPVQLKVLGMPRPSAVEFYLKQTNLPNNRLTTYGDLPSDAGGDLAGRKIYRHQGKAQNTPAIYTAAASNQQTRNQQTRNPNNDTERGAQAYRISTPGTDFRFTLRFDQLRPWELGALLAVLEPQRLARHLKPNDNQEYAHKLGYAKSLGLGSVRLSIDKLRYRKNDGWEWHEVQEDTNIEGFVTEHLKSLLSKATDAQTLERWLTSYHFTKNSEAHYPTKLNQKNEETIFNFHTDLRRNHAAARRGNPKNFSELKTLLDKE